MNAERFGIVFEPLDLRRHVQLVATLEVDDAVSLLVPAAAETNRDTAVCYARPTRTCPRSAP